MAKKKIIFQGEPGANSDLACREAYPDYEPVPCPTFEDCFSAFSAGDVDLGMIPIENSVAGRVADIHHLMPTAKLHIIAERFLPIRDQLMAPKGSTLKSIKSVQSHVMALGQCRNIIREMKLKPLVAADTAGSAREVAEAKDLTRAAIEIGAEPRDGARPMPQHHPRDETKAAGRRRHRGLGTRSGGGQGSDARGDRDRCRAT